MSDAVDMCLYYKMLELPFDPKENGFAFSAEDLRAEMRRNILENRVAIAKSLDYDRKKFDAHYISFAA